MKKKLQSRKFIAWLVATGVLLYLMITGSVHFPAFIPWWGGITMFWLGVEGGTDMISAGRK